MNVEEVLKQSAETPLRNSPAGGIIADQLEVLTGANVDGSLTGKGAEEMLESVPADLKKRFLGQALDDKLVAFKSWNQIREAIANDPDAKSKQVILGIVTLVMVLAACFFGGMLGLEYINHGTVPTADHLLTVSGPLVVSLLLQFGFGRDLLAKAAMDYLSKRVGK